MQEASVREDRRVVTESFDVVIVGAGSAGCVLANRLTADPACRVLLLEAGGSDRHPVLAVPLAWTTAMQMPQVGWGYVTEPETGADGRALPQPRGRVLGGTSSINGMMYVRGQADDYDGWAQMGLAGWSYAEVLPYFRRSERSWRGEGPYHGVSGPLNVVPQPKDPALTPKMIATAEKLGYGANWDVNGEVQEGFGVPDFTIARGRRASTAKAFLAPALGRPNLEVRTGALVGRVVIEQGRAVGVEYRCGGRSERVGAGEVVLSGGAFGSPQMLMLSGIGPAAELKAAGIEPVLDLPGVGRNLQDHPLVLAIHQAAGPFSLHEELRLDRLAVLAAQWGLFGTGALTHMPMPVQGFVRLAPGAATPDCQFQVSSVSMAAQPWFPGWRTSPGHHFTTGAIQLRPHGRGDVTLRSADPADAPKIRLNLFQEEADKAFARRMFAFIREFFATEPAAGLVAAELLPGPGATSPEAIDAHIRSTIQTGMHPACTCAMGVGEEAVLDAELKVRGIEGLRVADCSVMPNVVSGNTNAPAIMIGEKASDMILGRTPPPPAELPSRQEVPAP
jgi:choline dehydrogenase